MLVALILLVHLPFVPGLEILLPTVLIGQPLVLSSLLDSSDIIVDPIAKYVVFAIFVLVRVVGAPIIKSNVSSMVCNIEYAAGNHAGPVGASVVIVSD